MPSSPQRLPQPGPDDNLVYVVPPWATRGEAPASPGLWRSIADFLAFEAKVLSGLLSILSAGYYLLPALYEAKSRLGVDLVPGVHAADLLPFLDRRLPEDPPPER
ncbi:MAG: hypothetical protein ACK41F_01430 [Fimbriimonadaceae bacterium]